MALKKKWIQRYQKIGGFVNLRQLHHSGMLDDRWKLLAIGKTSECVISNLRIGDPIEMHPLHQPQMVRLMVSGYKPAESKKPKKFWAAGKIGTGGAILGLCGDLQRSIEMHCRALHQLNQEFRSRTLSDVIPRHCQCPKSIAYYKSWISIFVPESDGNSRSREFP